jgi:ketosteroid isomerase-like protein
VGSAATIAGQEARPEARMSETERQHVERLQDAYGRWSSSKGADSQSWIDLMADTVSFRSLGAAAPAIGFSRNGYSRAEVGRYFEELARDWEMVQYAVEFMVAEADRVAVLAQCSWRNRQTGRTIDTMKADFFRFADGRVIEFAELFDTAGAVAAATP